MVIEVCRAHERFIESHVPNAVPQDSDSLFVPEHDVSLSRILPAAS